MRDAQRYCRSVHRGTTLVALLLIAFGTVALVVGAAGITPPRAQPLLLETAAAHPDESVAIIVQKQTTDDRVERLTTQLGGKVTGDLHIIKAFSAELPGRAVSQLARVEGVRWISLDAPTVKSACSSCVDTTNLANLYVQEIGASRLWNESPSLQGQGVTVAVVDSGITTLSGDFNQAWNGRGQNISRITGAISFNLATFNIVDWYGHGTHVAGIIGGNGKSSGGAYIGVAPKVNLLSVKVSNDRGAGSTSDAVKGLQWIYENRLKYNIRVVNLSLNSSVAESYNTSPLDAALEILWFNKIVVVVSAGNNGTRADNGIMYPPANDPYVITVGATDDKGTLDIGDDTVAAFSAKGRTTDLIRKPDILAPGTNIISLLSGTTSRLALQHPDHIVSNVRGTYFRMSGTSMASAVASGAVALLIQSNPALTPDQIKYRLKATARPLVADTSRAKLLDIYAAVHSNTLENANTSLTPSDLLSTGTPSSTWDSVNWNSVNWNSVNWNSVNWNSVNWNQ